MPHTPLYFISEVGSGQLLRPGHSVDYCTEPEQAIEMAERLNEAENMRHVPGPMVEAVRIDITPIMKKKPVKKTAKKPVRKKHLAFGSRLKKR